MPFDLFGEIPVIRDEVHAWCEKVAGMTGWRRDWYTRHWNIIEKVRRAKVNGTFYETIAEINSLTLPPSTINSYEARRSNMK